MKKAMKNRGRGFTLVELMIVVAIIGVLATMAIFGVRKYLANAKTAEARNNLGQIANDAAAAFERETSSGAILAGGSASANLRQLCPTGPAVPADIPKSSKYQTKPTDWIDGWKCLKFSIETPQYYQYTYTKVDDTNYTAVAKGDLNGDGNPSTFTILGQVVSGALTKSPSIKEEDPEE